MSGLSNFKNRVVSSANSLIFEQAIYGIDPGRQPPQVRQTAGITIISKKEWWSADVVEVQLSSSAGSGGPATVTAAQIVQQVDHLRLGQ